MSVYFFVVAFWIHTLLDRTGIFKMDATSFQIHSKLDTSLHATLRVDSAGGEKNNLWHKNLSTSFFLDEPNVIGKGLQSCSHLEEPNLK